MLGISFHILPFLPYWTSLYAFHAAHGATADGPRCLFIIVKECPWWRCLEMSAFAWWQRNYVFVASVWSCRRLPCGVISFKVKPAWNVSTAECGFSCPAVAQTAFWSIWIEGNNTWTHVSGKKKSHCATMSAFRRSRPWFEPNDVNVSVWVRTHVTSHAWLTADAAPKSRH